MSPPPKQRAPNPYDIPTPASYSLSPHAHPMHTYQHSPGAASGSGSASWSGAPAPESSSSRVPKQEFDDEEDEDTLASPPPGEVKKAKTTRGSRACTVCRKLKMRCVGAEQGPPCKRCKSGNHECIFEESQRGRRSNRKTDAMAKSLKKMEATLETVLKSISNPAVLASAGGMISDANARQLSPMSVIGLALDAAGGMNSVAGDHQTADDDGPARGSSVVEGSVVRFESGLGRQGMQWGGRKRSDGGGAGRDSPRLHSLPDNTLNPLGLLAEASLQNTRKRAHPSPLSHTLGANGETSDEDDGEGGRRKKTKLGVANTGYFQPGPMNILPLRRIVIEQRMPPALLVEKIVTIEEVVELFALFFEHCQRGAPFLDPETHTPTATGSRSPFLFTCICAVAARYYTKRTDDLYRKCLKTAKRVAFDVMTRGFKSVEIVQGFLLLCHWNQPAERFEEDRTWAFSGLAIRMATDLNLNRKTLAVLPDDVSEETRTLYEREIRNRERTYLYVYICDKSLSAQMGKPSSIPKEDFLLRNAKEWHLQRGASKSDVGLSAMVEMHRMVSRMLDTLYSDTRSISGLNVHLDYSLLMRGFLTQIDQWRNDWTVAFAMDPNDPTDMIRFKMREFYASYYRLFVLSFGVQHALDNPDLSIELPSFCVLAFESASSMIAIARDYLGPHGVLRYAIDSTYVYLSYAATFLLKLISPAFSTFVVESTVIALVRDVADTFERCAVDDSHTPALYASFLRALIENKLSGGRTAPGSCAGTRPSSPNPGHGHTRNTSTTGMESFMRSRQASLGPDAERGEGMPMSEADAHHASMDTMLNATSFWDSYLMPGFGNSTFGGLSAGSGVMLSSSADPWSVTPMHSRPGSPSAFGGIDFAPHS